MEVFLNEESIYLREEMDSDAIVKFLGDSLEILDNYNIKIYSNKEAFSTFFNDIRPDTQRATFFTLLLKNIYNFKRNNYPKYYYYYFIHQDFGLSINQNISDTSLAAASDKISHSENVVVLNIPASYYCFRPKIPIIKSPYISNQEDILINIPCFNNIGKLINSLLIFKLKSFIPDDQFLHFKSNYSSIIDHFNFNNWQPLNYKSQNKLDAKIAFPASGNAYLANFFSNLKIELGGNYNDNISRYKELGSIVLNLHGYIKNYKISGKYKREVFEGGIGNKKLLISLDTENGLLEVIDNKGVHIGVYNYAGEYQKHYTNQDDINNHSLKDLPRNFFLSN